MNLTGQPIHQKGESRPKRGARAATSAEQLHWGRVLEAGCIVGPVGCEGRLTIHHCFTGAGGRKDHTKVLPLCWEHHQGRDGIDGREFGMSKRKWQEKHGTEAALLAKLLERLGP